MFANLAGCTIYEKIRRDRQPAYVRHTTGAVYWEPSHGQTEGADRVPQTSDFISIPATSTDYLPKKDDRIVSSIIEDEAPPPDAMTVMQVKDLRYGSPKVQHIELTAR